MAAPNKLSRDDKKDLDKFTKYLVYKCIQIIVQSRLGERVKTQSRPYSTGSDWFNLAIKDLPEVLAETKKVVSTGTLSLGQHVCVEISLKTTEGESMVLETWWLHFTDQKDPLARIFYTVYNRMSLMLKSLFCVTRATPAYRLSRKQGPDTYVMCYRIYNSEPETTLLGSGFETQSVGKVPTPLGTISLSVAFRTKMLISPYSSKELVEDLKDDHFKSETSPRSHTIPKPCCLIKGDARHVITEDGFAFGESEFCASSFSTSPPDHCTYNMQYPVPSPQVGHCFLDNMGKTTVQKHAQLNGEIGDVGPKVVKPNNPTKAVNGFHSESNGVHSHGNKIDFEQISAFVSDGESEDEIDGSNDQKDSTEIPFVQLVKNISKMQIDSNANKTKDSKHITCENGYNGFCDINGQANGCAKMPSAVERLRNASGESSGSSRGSGCEDYVMIDMKSALTGMDDNPELGQFYRDIQEAPALSMFNANDSTATRAKPRQHTSPARRSAGELFNSITDQLLQFEAQGHEFDDFVNSLSTQEV